MGQVRTDVGTITETDYGYSAASLWGTGQWDMPGMGTFKCILMQDVSPGRLKMQILMATLLMVITDGRMPGEDKNKLLDYYNFLYGLIRLR